MHPIEVGFGCNNVCAFCAQGELRDVTSPPALDALLARVDAAPKDDVVAFVGGEPTLMDELPALVRRARSAGVEQVLVQTNGRRLAVPGYARTLADAGVTRLEVALQGSSAAMHDYHTGVPGSFRATVSGLRHARAAGLAFVQTTVVTRSNFRHLSEIVRVAHALGARGAAFAPVAEAGRAAAQAARLRAPLALLTPHLRHALARAQMLGLQCAAPAFGAGSSTLDGWLAGLGAIDSAAAPAHAKQSVVESNVYPLERLVRSRVDHGFHRSSVTR